MRSALLGPAGVGAIGLGLVLRRYVPMTAKGWWQELVMTATMFLYVLAQQNVSVYFMDCNGMVNGRTKWPKDCGLFRMSGYVEECAHGLGIGEEIRVNLVCTPSTFLYVAKLFDIQFTESILNGDDVVNVLMLMQDLRLRSGDEKTTFYRNLARVTDVDSSLLKKVERFKMKILDVSMYALQLLRKCARAQGMDVRVGRQNAVLCAQSHQYCFYGCTEKVETIVSVKVDFRVGRAVASVVNSLQEVLGWFIDVSGVSTLDVQRCRVSGLAAWVGGLGRLQVLNMSRTGIDVQDLVHLQGLKRLKKLNISHNRLRRGVLMGICMEQPVEDSLEAIVSLTDLLCLDMAHCKLNAQDIMRVGEIRSLQELCVSGNSMDKECVSALCRLNSLKLLCMDNCELVEGSLVDLQKLVMLESLHVSKNKLSKDDVASIGTLKTLILLKIVDCSLVRGSLVHLQGLVRLRSLYVSQNRLEEEDLVSINKLQSLRELDIQNCSVGSRELGWLQRELDELNVSGVQLAAESAFAIGKMWSLRRLHMHNCGKKRGVLASLGELKNLEYLSVSQTKLRAEDTAAIGKMVSLQVLNMYKCQVEKGSLGTLAGLEQLRCLDVSGTPLSETDRETLRRMRNKEVVGMCEESSTASSFVFMWPYGEMSLRSVLGGGEKRKEGGPGDESGARGGDACAYRAVHNCGDPRYVPSELQQRRRGRASARYSRKSVAEAKAERASGCRECMYGAEEYGAEGDS